MSENLVPVFAFPTTLTFYLNDQSTHKQVLTILNPYDHPIRFQVLCTSRNKYTVVDPEGKIDAHCCVDIVIRHNAVNNQNVGHTDKFRIQMFQLSSNKVWGKKDIPSELLAGDPESEKSLSNERELFQQLPSSASSYSSNAQYVPLRHGQVRPGAPNAVVVVVAVLFALILMLPMQGESNSLFPEYLKPNVNVKLFAAYVLGLITMVFLRPT